MLPVLEKSPKVGYNIYSDDFSGVKYMTLQQIQYVLRVAECGSINKAAEGLFITQPTLTKAVKELEREIGISLFLRTHKGVTPTAEGALFLEKCRNMYTEYEKLHDEYSDKRERKGTFRVTAKPCSFAVKAFVELAKKCDLADLELSVREADTPEVINDVSSLRSEIGILDITPSNRRFIERLMVENELRYSSLISGRTCVYLSSSHPLANEAEISPHQLAPYPYVCFEEELCGENTYPRTIRISDKAAMLAVINGLDGFAVGFELMCEPERAGLAVIPLKTNIDSSESITDIGYITKKYSPHSEMAERYLYEIRKCLE